MAANAQLSFVTNGQRAVLNDRRTGRTWAVQRQGELINNWNALIAADTQQPQAQQNNTELQPEVEKIQVACDAREDAENFLVIARTDARAGDGVDAALRRLEAYAEAGADILFFEAPQSEDEMRTACAAFDKPSSSRPATR